MPTDKALIGNLRLHWSRPKMCQEAEPLRTKIPDNFFGFHHSPDKNRDAFIRFLEGCNMVVNVRRSKGKDIDAACGQLAGKQESNL